MRCTMEGAERAAVVTHHVAMAELRHPTPNIHTHARSMLCGWNLPTAQCPSWSSWCHSAIMAAPSRSLTVTTGCCRRSPRRPSDSPCLPVAACHGGADGERGRGWSRACSVCGTKEEKGCDGFLVPAGGPPLHQPTRLESHFW